MVVHTNQCGIFDSNLVKKKNQVEDEGFNMGSIGDQNPKNKIEEKGKLGRGQFYCLPNPENSLSATQ